MKSEDVLIIIISPARNPRKLERRGPGLPFGYKIRPM